jgi:hypothetical protein
MQKINTQSYDSITIQILIKVNNIINVNEYVIRIISN